MTNPTNAVPTPSMNFNLNTEFGYACAQGSSPQQIAANAKVLAHSLLDFAAVVEGTVAAAPKAGKVEVKQAAAPEPEAAKPAASPTASTAAETVSGAASPADEVVAYEDVREAVTALAATGGRAKVVAVLDTFGVDHASKLTEAQWPEALAALKAAA